MLNPSVGDSFVLARPFGVGAGSLEEGERLEVVDMVTAGTLGVGGDGDDRLLLSHTSPGTVLNEDGEPTEGTVTRTLSLTNEELSGLVETDDGG